MVFGTSAGDSRLPAVQVYMQYLLLSGPIHLMSSLSLKIEIFKQKSVQFIIAESIELCHESLKEYHGLFLTSEKKSFYS
jgi:hypothetical protein